MQMTHCSPPPPARRGATEGYAVAGELEWGPPGYEAAVRRLAAEPVDWVLAADCCYIDQVGRRCQGGVQGDTVGCVRSVP
jgi:hypothetical protein